MSVETDRITDAHRAEALLDQIDGLAALIRDGLPAPDSVDFALDDETGRYNITCHYADPTPAITIELLRHLDTPNAEVSGGGYRRYSWDRPGDLGVVVDVRDQDRGAARLLARAATIAEVGS